MWVVTRFIVLCFICAPAFACDYPDEGNMPLRRAVSKVKYLPQTQAWASATHESGGVAQYALLLDAPHRSHGRCYWPVEVRADGKLWRRYYVSPDGTRLLHPEESASAGRPVP